MEIDLLSNYPRAKRDLSKRAEEKTEEDRRIARRFGKEFFDGERRHGYGGFSYHPRFWQPVIPGFVKHYGLSDKSKVLDVGCAKGFMLHDFTQLVPGVEVRGIDISEYAIEQAVPNVKPFLSVGNAIELPFDDKYFDLAIAINTIHNLDQEGCLRALRELQRVARRAFLTVDAYRSEEEHERMFMWNLTARTILHVDEWEKLFKLAGYTGDYYWFIP